MTLTSSFIALTSTYEGHLKPWASLVDSSMPFPLPSHLVTCVTSWLVLNRHNPCAPLWVHLGPLSSSSHLYILTLHPSTLLPINWIPSQAILTTILEVKLLCHFTSKPSSTPKILPPLKPSWAFEHTYQFLLDTSHYQVTNPHWESHSMAHILIWGFHFVHLICYIDLFS